MITTYDNLPPMIRYPINPYLLDPLLGMLRMVEDKLIPLSQKKIRTQDTGKKKAFSELLPKVREEYERKKIEEAKYNEKIKNATKRSCLPAKGGSMQFKRIQSENPTA